jgi:HEPN domain-containing protein
MLDLARQNLRSAEDAIKRHDYVAAVIHSIDAIEYALKYPLAVLGIKIEYDKKSKQKSHDVRKYYADINKFLSFLPSGEYYYEQLIKKIFIHSFWLKVRNLIRYGLEEHPIKFSSPTKFVDEELARLAVKHAQETVGFIETLDTIYQQKQFENVKEALDKIRKIENINPITSDDIDRVKSHLEKLVLAREGKYSMSMEEYNSIVDDINNFNKKLEEEKKRLPQYSSDFEELLKALAAVMLVLIIIGLILEVFKNR